MKRQLVIFARSPRLGVVKRRLARDIGAVAAWRFYSAVLGRMVLRLARDPRWECSLATTGGPARWPSHVSRIDQGRGDLDANLRWIAEHTNPDGYAGDLAGAVRGADVFIGVSAPNLLSGEEIAEMNEMKALRRRARRPARV